MNSHIRLIVISLFSISLFLGCASSKRISSQQAELDNLKREIRFMKQQNSQFQRELDNLSKKLNELELANRQDKADLGTKFDEVLQQVEELRNQIQDISYRITAVKQRGGLSGTFDSSQGGFQSGADTSGGQSTMGVDESRELYNTAYRDLIRGNYQLALQGFQQFMQQFPNSELADNAQYYIGEVYYAQGRYQNAIEEYEKVSKWYRQGDKTPSALLKIGYSYINIDEPEQGKLYLNQVIKDHPDSEEANLAKGRLASLE